MQPAILPDAESEFDKDFRQTLDALKDLVISSDPYGREDHAFSSALHNARLVLKKHLNRL